MSISVIDTLRALGNFPVANSTEIQCGNARLDAVLNATATELATKASKTYVDQQIAAVDVSGKADKTYVDSNFAKKTDVPAKTSQLTNDTGFLTQQSLANYVQTTDARLSNARPASDVSAWAKSSTKPDYTKSEVGLGNVDNTSDMSKPVSTATQTALNGKADNTTVSNISDRVSSVETEQIALSARMDTFEQLPEGSTTGDAELADIHIGYNGKQYDTAGDAVRGQVSDLRTDLDNLGQYDITWTDGYYVNASNENVAHELYCVSNAVKLNGVPGIYVNLSFDGNAKFLFLDKEMNPVQYISSVDTYLKGAVKVNPKACYFKCCTLISYKSQSSVFVDCLSLVENSLQGFKQIVNSSVLLSNCNDALPNRIYSISANVVSNAPDGNQQGTLVTLAYGDSDVGKIQIFVSTNNLMFFRFYWMNWSGWRELVDTRNYASTLGSMVNSKGTYTGNDLNSIGINTVYNITSNKSVSDLANAPFYPFQGSIFTVGGSSTGNVAMQLAISPLSDKMYYRKYWGNWSKWRTLEEQVLPYLNNQIGYEAFLKVGCIGDSLASGECYSNESGSSVGHDIYKYSWGQFMARNSGNTYYNFSKGGLSTRTWLTSEYRQQVVDGNHNCTAYIIGLGANDALEDYRHVEVGSISDIDIENYDNNADTYYGNYGKIIQILHAYNPKTKIFLLTMPNSNSIYQPYNAAVRELASTFDNCYCIDLYSNAFDLYNGSNSIIRNGLRNGHYNAYAYGMMAKVISNEINKFMNNNKAEFDEIEFIDTNYSWN